MTYDDPHADDIRSALATLVAREPELPSGVDDIERSGRRGVARRRYGQAALTVAACAALGIGGATYVVSGPSPTNPVAVPPTTAVPAPGEPTSAGTATDTPPTEPPGGTGVQAGFTVDEAASAVNAALPNGAALGPLPDDRAWHDGVVALPLNTSGGNGTLTLRIVDGACSASVTPADLLSPSALDTVADAVCAAWVAGGSLPVGTGTATDAPDLAAQ